MNDLLKKAGLLAAVSALAACASTPTDTGPIDPVDTAGPVIDAGPQGPVGPVPGTPEDFEQNAGHRVFFGYNQYNLTNEARQTLDRQAAWLKEYPESRLRLVGNADERGTREYNLALGARRANAAKAYLVARGVDPSRVTTISYGKERPLDTRSTPDAWARNRNATTMLVTLGGTS